MQRPRRVTFSGILSHAQDAAAAQEVKAADLARRRLIRQLLEHAPLAIHCHTPHAIPMALRQRLDGANMRRPYRV